MSYNVLGFLGLSILAILAGGFLSNRLRTWYDPRLLVLAITLRILGSTARYEILFNFYHGLGDAVRYYYDGLALAGFLNSPGESVFSLEFWIPSHGAWWGTRFITRISAVVLRLIGPTMRGEFLVFSLISFVGIYLIAAAFRRVQPGRQASKFTSWISFWPSLWFWPASVGKEALLVLGMGLATYGFAGRGKGVIWPALAAGVGLCFAIRPHVAAVVALSILAAQWLGTWDQFSLRRIVESGIALAIAFVALQGMASQFGLDLTDAEGVKDFVDFRATRTQAGGSQIGAVPVGATGIPMAFVNIWMRPFPWEAHNATSLLAAAEIVVFWWLAWQRRKGLRLALGSWRHHRLLRFAVPLLIAYTLMIGLTFSNLGIIARQRSPIVPFMFMVVLAAPEAATASARRRRSARELEPPSLPSPANG